jgi:hypothetical protein
MDKYKVISDALVKAGYTEEQRNEVLDWLDKLLDRDDLLVALETAGVEDWVEYPYAVRMLEEWRREDRRK